MKNVVLECKNIIHKYKNKERRIVVLNGVNYKFKTGKIYAVVGKSGVGKTTLINILGLLFSPTSGDVFINGMSTAKMCDKKLSFIRNQNIGFIFQSFYLNPLMNAFENIALPMYINSDKSNKDISDRVKKLLSLVELDDRASHFSKELSGGEQQRIAIARALANDPNIILADEPTGSLDPENEANIMKILNNMSKSGKCVIIVTHSEKIREYVDVVLEIKNGTIVEVKK